MESACSSAEAKRYTRWLIPMALLTAAAVIAVSWTLENRELGAELRIGLAVTPVLLWGGMVLLMVAGIRHGDELQQRIQLEALAITGPPAMMLGMLVEYLQKAGFATSLTVGDVWPWMFLIYLPAYFFARLRYR
jgi:hypothetical protein